MSVGLDHLVKTDYIWVRERTQDGDLTIDFGQTVWMGRHGIPSDQFDRDLDPAISSPAQFDLPKLTLAECLTQNVLPKPCLLPRIAAPYGVLAIVDYMQTTATATATAGAIVGGAISTGPAPASAGGF